jgi:hypothetical protein
MALPGQDAALPYPDQNQPNRELTITKLESLTFQLAEAFHSNTDPKMVTFIHSVCAKKITSSSDYPSEEFLPSEGYLTTDEYVAQIQRYKTKYPDWKVRVERTQADLSLDGRTAVVWLWLRANGPELMHDATVREVMYKMFWCLRPREGKHDVRDCLRITHMSDIPIIAGRWEWTGYEHMAGPGGFMLGDWCT